MDEIIVLDKFPIVLTKDSKWVEEVPVAKEGAIIVLPADAVLVLAAASPPQESLDKHIGEILATHRSETWNTGWNNDATEKATQQLKQLLLEYSKEQAIKELEWVRKLHGDIDLVDMSIKDRLAELSKPEEGQ